MERKILIVLSLTAYQGFSGAIDCNTTIPNGHLSVNCTGRANETCAFQCDPGFLMQTDVSSVKCQPSGSWNSAIYQLCTGAVTNKKLAEVKCTDDVPNGSLDHECVANPGESCAFGCNAGYKVNSTIKNIVCLTSGDWDRPVGQLCIEMKCTHAVPNGFLGLECVAKPGTSCSFGCNTGYRLHNANKQIICLASGDWDRPVGDLCNEEKCNEVVPHGFLGCTAKPEESCTFECKTGYRESNVNKQITCLTSGDWDKPVGELCIEVKCTYNVPNGFMVPGCTAKPGESCVFRCNTGYRVNNENKQLQVVCLTSGDWDIRVTQLCIVDNVVMPEVETEDDSSVIRESIGGTLGGMAVVGIVLFVKCFCYPKIRHKELPRCCGGADET